MAEFLWEQFDISPSLSSISRGLKNSRFSRKRLHSAAAERNEELRLNWKKKISRYNPQQLVFLDESAASETTSHCRTEWSLFSIAPVAYQCLHCRKRFSILPAYSLDGYIAYRIIPNSYNKERFLDFVRECVLPLCMRDWHVICLDNVATHKSKVKSFGSWISTNYYRNFKSFSTPPALGVNIFRHIHLIIIQ